MQRLTTISSCLLTLSLLLACAEPSPTPLSPVPVITATDTPTLMATVTPNTTAQLFPVELKPNTFSPTPAPTTPVAVEPAKALPPALTPTPTPVELASGLEKHLLMLGTPQETPVYIIGSGQPGPVVLVIGGVHGDEPSGWLAAERIIDFKPELGALLVVPQANRQAILLGSRTTPELGDLNRLYPGDTEGLPMARMAAEIVGLIEEYGVDVVVDLHESWEFYMDRPYRSRAFLGQTITTFPSEQAASIAQDVLASVNQQILDPREKMVHREYPPRSVSELTIPDQLDEPDIGHTLRAGGRSSLGLGRRFSGMTVMLVEMSQQLPLERRVALHVLVTKEVLEVLVMWRLP